MKVASNSLYVFTIKILTYYGIYVCTYVCVTLECAHVSTYITMISGEGM